MKKIEIANKHGVEPSFLTPLLRGDKKTTIIPLAIDLAIFAGKKPIYFLSKRKGFRKYHLAENPSLGKRMGKAS
ncbi:MAG: hypothetical protein C4586_08575 [Anaerolineaceae bacterium]|nr:MAG: hypothetical protein C4586_08575 [Anaerolineaceae bacterium]